VIWTDAVQFGLFMAGGLFTLCYIPSLMEGGFSAVMQKAAEGGKLHWLNPEFSLTMPFNIWMGIIGGTFVVLSSHGAEQLIVQRVLACKNVADGRKALITSAVVIFPLFLIFLLVGAMLWVYYQSNSVAVSIPEARPGIKKLDFIYPIFMVTAVPHILKGFLIVAILSAAMSSVSSALTSLASVSTMDFVKGLTRGAKTDRFYLQFSKYSTVFWAVMLIFVAYLSKHVEYVLNTAFSLRGLTSGALLGSLALVVLWKRAPAIAIFVGMIAALGTMIWVSRIQLTTAAGAKAGIAWPWYTLIGTIVCVGLAWITRKIVFVMAGNARVRKDDAA
jgi:SSS family solute:Na+ symporter